MLLVTLLGMTSIVSDDNEEEESSPNVNTKSQDAKEISEEEESSPSVPSF